MKFLREICALQSAEDIEFMPQPLPKTGQGKIDRQRLLAHNERGSFTLPPWLQTARRPVMYQRMKSC